MARIWNWQRWGRHDDLIHQSDLNGFIGKFGCPSQLRRKKEERAAGKVAYENAGGKLAVGNAAHGVIHRVLKSKLAPQVLALPDEDTMIHRVDPAHVEKAFDEEFAAEVNGRPIDWYKTNPEKIRSEALAMVNGLFEILHKHVGEVVLTESAFVYQLGGIWMTGSVDLIYRARLKNGDVSTRISFADWKTGAQRPHQIDLDHGWQSGIYGNALMSAWFVPFDAVPKVEGERHRDTVENICLEVAAAQHAVDELNLTDDDFDSVDATTPEELALQGLVERFSLRRFDEYPEHIRYVHMRDLIPYTRKQKKMLTRPEELEWMGLSAPESHQFEKGEHRGPAFYRVQRAASDTPRLLALLKAIVGSARFGHFPAAPGEMCARCKFRGPCLTDGYQPIGEEKKRLEQIQKTLDGFDGFDDDD